MKFIYSTLWFLLITSVCTGEESQQYFSDIHQSQNQSIPNQSEENIPRLLTEDEYRLKIKELFEDEVQSNLEDRHALTASLNACTPTEKDSRLIIGFEGTGAYEPYIPALMERARIKYRDRVSEQDFSKTLNHVTNIVKKAIGKESKWSGLMHGVMKTLYKDQSLLEGNFNWYSYPSEEAEVLAGLDSINAGNLMSLYEDIKNSVNSNPKGIQGALACTQKFIRGARELDYFPKVIVVTHSSGGRSVVKFAEHLKSKSYIDLEGQNQTGIKIDLVMTIDPVKEAHEAIKEAALQLSGSASKSTLNFFLPERFEVDNPAPRVWSRNQPNSLYKPSNVKRFVNVYQKQDTLGLKLSVKFGIWGSPIADADEQFEITSDLGDAGHGEIAYHRDTIDLFKRELGLISR